MDRLILFCALLLMAPITFAGDFQKGVDCYNKKDFDCAFREFKTSVHDENLPIAPTAAVLA
jgi:hypothetical protein